MNKTLEDLKKQLNEQQDKRLEIELELRRIAYELDKSNEIIKTLKKAIRQKEKEMRQIARENRRAAKSAFIPIPPPKTN